MKRCTVLVVEDDTAIRRGLVDALTYAGYGVLDCDNGRTALEVALESSIDLVLLDVMLPSLDGFGVLQELRRTRPTLPVIMVTARGAEEDRLRGLGDGADDYVIKPFSARELLARVEAVLRRSPQRASDVLVLRAGDCTIDLQRREVSQPGVVCRQLTEREVEILRYLAANRGRAIDRSELLRHVWGLNPRGIQTRTVDMHIARLRDKLRDTVDDRDDHVDHVDHEDHEDHVDHEDHEDHVDHVIRTVRGKGYMLAATVEVDP